MAEFEAPKSPNAAALQNILGADNVLREPQSENETLLQMIAEQTQALISTLNEVKNTVDILSSIQRYRGVTTTELVTGSTTNPIEINGASVTVINGDAVIYNGEDFVFNGEIWQSVPDALGALAYKSSARGNYTPQGTISKPILIVGSIEENISVLSSVGTLPTLTYDANAESLTFEQGTLPKEGYQTINYVESVEVEDAPIFTGTAATITVE